VQELAARVRVRVEETELEDLPQHGRGARAQSRGGVEASSPEVGGGSRWMASQVLGRQYPCRAALADYCGNHDLAVAGEQLPQPPGGTAAQATQRLPLMTFVTCPAFPLRWL
jgi:hypothetical protein